ncbi:hypothetical protein KHS38_20260 [Mucilaginibacter sp. Bleaf8]|uniref:DUF3592 domain-containing protein n=1 Tax=Mucilaginibacter sp. Bleaf8 TaxID=2834430 RepID=UPI001BD07465|nr:DUF3592 domain-containing protein [Mucilaginibacter sp. Bleaf8]MBS7566750.1 hypothetical protein [Mucilaginibacter sp. Bleaf8]
MDKSDRIFSFLAIIAGLAVIVLSINSNSRDNHLRKTGEKAIASVVRTTVTINNPKSRTYNSFKDKSVWGVYQFKGRNGQIYEVQGKTSGAHLGEKTIIYYDPINPEQDFYLDSDAYGFFLGIGIGLDITVLGAIFFIRSSR